MASGDNEDELLEGRAEVDGMSESLPFPTFFPSAEIKRSATFPIAEGPTIKPSRLADTSSLVARVTFGVFFPSFFAFSVLFICLRLTPGFGSALAIGDETTGGDRRLASGEGIDGEGGEGIGGGVVIG